MNQPSDPVHVFAVCTGVGIFNRGIETFFRNCFDGLHGWPGLNLTLFKGAGPDATDEVRVRCLPRTGRAAHVLGKFIRRNAYTVEQLSFFPGLVKHIRRRQPQVIFYSDFNLGMQLYKRRKWVGVPYRLLYSNGAPMRGALPFTDHVQQVTPIYHQEAIDAGDPPDKLSLVPYGIIVPDGPPLTAPDERMALRHRLGLPADRPIVLSVGWISHNLKRMDYTISEIARLPQPRPFLVLLGAMDETSPPILAQARDQLGETNFVARSVKPYEVDDYYRAADVFALASIREGFGRVYLEAMIHGLPCIVNDHPVSHYVLDAEGTYADLTQPGAMADELERVIGQPADPDAMARRRESVRRRFAWSNLAPHYLDMFCRCAQGPMR